MIESGEDLRREQKAIRKTVAQLIEDRMALVVRPIMDPKTGAVVRAGLRSHKEVQRRYNKYVIPTVGNVPVNRFTVEDLNTAVAPLIARSKALNEDGIPTRREGGQWHETSVRRIRLRLEQATVA
jgi:hypothetical protein